jgi:hypothetical protein
MRHSDAVAMLCCVVGGEQLVPRPSEPDLSHGRIISPFGYFYIASLLQCIALGISSGETCVHTCTVHIDTFLKLATFCWGRTCYS